MHLSYPGEHNPQAKLTADQVLQIRQQYADGATQQQVATAMDIAPAQVSRIVRGTAWKHLPCPPLRARRWVSPRSIYDWATVDPLLIALPTPTPFGSLAQLGRDYQIPAISIRERMRRLRRLGMVSPPHRGQWTVAEDDQLVHLYARAAIPVIARLLQRSETAITERILRTGIADGGYSDVE